MSFSTFSLKELLQEPPEEEDWIIEDLITTGLHLLVGPSKVGKSWIVLQISICVAQGDSFLGFATHRTGVLYLALEDTKKRVKKRSWKLVDETDGDVDFVTSAGKIADTLLPDLNEYLDEHPGTKLVIIDTLQMVRDGSGDSSYSSDYSDITCLKKLADERGIALLLVHHTRKMAAPDVFDTVSGTTGIVGAADSTMVLSDVNRATGSAKLSMTGRDRDYLELKLRFRDCRWSLVEVTSKEELEERSIPEDVLRTVDFMGEHPEWEGTPTELLEAIKVEGVSVAAFGKHLAQHADFMSERGIDYRRRHDRAGTMLRLERAEGEEKAASNK